jgi:uncharacterized protein (TIGR03000 family)
MLRRIMTLAAFTTLAVICSLLAAGPVAAQGQGWFYSQPNSYSNTRPSTYSPRTYYYAPPISDASYYMPSDAPSDRAVRVTVHVPASAEIWFDGNPTRQRGERRTYVSPPLAPDAALHYDVRALWVDGGGRTVDQTRRVAVRAGELSMVDFLSQESAMITPKSGAASNPRPSAMNTQSSVANRP